MSHQFYVGQQVACIDAGYAGHQAGRVTLPLGLEQGRIYEIRWLGPWTNYVDGNYIGIRVQGVHRGVCPTYGEFDTPYHSRRFRPLMKDLIAVFRNMVVPQPVDGTPFLPNAPEGPKRKAPMHDDAPSRSGENV
jgi:hypothetical protein